MSARGDSGVYRVEIDGELTIVTAADENQRLLSAISDGDAPLVVDLSGVTDLDTAGLQVLLLCKREAGRRDLAIEFHDPSPAVRDVLAVARLNEALDGTALDGTASDGDARHGTETEA